MAAPSHGTAALSKISPEADEKLCAELREIVYTLLDDGTTIQYMDETDDLFMRLINLAQICRASLFFSVSALGGCNALHAAAIHLHPEYCDLLLARGADPAATTDDGWTAAHFLALHGHFPRVGYVGKIGDVSGREARIVDVLVKCGINLDAPNSEGKTALSIVCGYGMVNLARALLEAPGERAGWDRSSEIVVNADVKLLEKALDGNHIEIFRLLCCEYRPRVLVELDRGDEYQSLEEMARESGLDEIADFLGGVAFVRRKV